jgi:hypothetical protein
MHQVIRDVNSFVHLPLRDEFFRLGPVSCEYMWWITDKFVSALHQNRGRWKRWCSSAWWSSPPGGAPPPGGPHPGKPPPGNPPVGGPPPGMLASGAAGTPPYRVFWSDRNLLTHCPALGGLGQSDRFALYSATSSSVVIWPVSGLITPT